MKNKIKEILLKYDEYKIPVNVVSLAQKIGFSIIQQDLDYDGAMLIDNNKEFKIDNKPYNMLIIINNNQFYKRKIFTIAHELGHYFNDFNNSTEKIYAHREESNKFDKKEIEANNFASELLMPTELLKEFVNEIKKKYTDYYLITNAIESGFGVSHAAAEYRYDKLLRGE